MLKSLIWSDNESESTTHSASECGISRQINLAQISKYRLKTQYLFIHVCNCICASVITVCLPCYITMQIQFFKMASSILRNENTGNATAYILDMIKSTDVTKYFPFNKNESINMSYPIYHISQAYNSVIDLSKTIILIYIHVRSYSADWFSRSNLFRRCSV